MKNKAYDYCEVTEIKDLKEMLYKKAEECPDNTAFIYPCESGEMKKTFLDLYEDVNAMGTWLYSKKIKNKRVAVIGENSYEWLVTYFALVNGGNVAVAIDKALPDDEIKTLAKIGDVDMAFVTSTYADKVIKNSIKKGYDLKDFEKFFSEGRKLLKEGHDEFLKYEINVQDTATVLFTS